MGKPVIETRVGKYENYVRKVNNMTYEDLLEEAEISKSNAKENGYSRDFLINNIILVDYNQPVAFGGGGNVYDRGSRPSPKESATLYPEGYEATGQDGNEYYIAIDKRGIHRWQKLVGGKSDSNQKIADRLIKIEGRIWNELGIDSSDIIFSDNNIQINLIKRLRAEIGTEQFSQKVHDILVDENYHTLSNFLSLNGNYGKESQDQSVKWIYGHEKNLGYSFNPANFGFKNPNEKAPESIPELSKSETIKKRIAGLELAMKYEKDTDIKASIKKRINALSIALEYAKEPEPKPSVVNDGVEREAWLLTKKEFFANPPAKVLYAGEIYERSGKVRNGCPLYESKNFVECERNIHLEIVKDAVKAGHHVSPLVLNDYPELADVKSEVPRSVTLAKLETLKSAKEEKDKSKSDGLKTKLEIVDDVIIVH